MLRKLKIEKLIAVIAASLMSCETKKITRDSSLEIGTYKGLEVLCSDGETVKLRIKGFRTKLNSKGGAQYGKRSPTNRYHYLNLSLRMFRDDNGKHWNIAWMSIEPEYLRVNEWLFSMKNGETIDLSSQEQADQPLSVKSQWVDKYELSFRELLESRLNEDIAAQLEDFLEREPTQVVIDTE